MMQDKLARREPGLHSEGASEFALAYVCRFRECCCVDDAGRVSVDTLPDSFQELVIGPCCEIHR